MSDFEEEIWREWGCLPYEDVLNAKSVSLCYSHGSCKGIYIPTITRAPALTTSY